MILIGFVYIYSSYDVNIHRYVQEPSGRRYGL